MPRFACFATALFSLALPGAWAVNADVPRDADDIAGVLASAAGPEAGVWVIAETDAFDTRFARIVVTDAQGRYLVPDLPDAEYRVWVRGYGLLDSKPVGAVPGDALNLDVEPARDPASAARVYPAAYWYAMMDLPDPAEVAELPAQHRCNADPGSGGQQRDLIRGARAGCRHAGPRPVGARRRWRANLFMYRDPRTLKN